MALKSDFSSLEKKNKDWLAALLLSACSLSVSTVLVKRLVTKLDAETNERSVAEDAGRRGALFICKEKRLILGHCAAFSLAGKYFWCPK